MTRYLKYIYFPSAIQIAVSPSFELKHGTIFVLVYVDEIIVSGPIIEETLVVTSGFTEILFICIKYDVTEFQYQPRMREGYYQISYHSKNRTNIGELLNCELSPYNVPLTPNMIVDSQKVCKNGYELKSAKMKYVTYREQVGALIRLTNTKHPDIYFYIYFMSLFIQGLRFVH